MSWNMSIKSKCIKATTTQPSSSLHFSYSNIILSNVLWCRSRQIASSSISTLSFKRSVRIEYMNHIYETIGSQEEESSSSLLMSNAWILFLWSYHLPGWCLVERQSFTVSVPSAHTQTGTETHGTAGVHLWRLLPRVDFHVETVTLHSREILERH